MPQPPVQIIVRPISPEPISPEPISPSPPIELDPGRRQGQLIAAARAAKIRDNLRLGGAASTLAIAAPMAAGQENQKLRPSQMMQLWANSGTKQSHKDALIQWMNENLKDAQLEMGKATAAITAGTEIAIPGLLLCKDAALVTKELGEKRTDLIGSTLQNTVGIANEIAKCFGGNASEVNDAMNVTGIFPIVGPIIDVCSAAGYTTFIIMTAWNKMQSKDQLATSCSVIEQVGLEAVISCDNADIANKSASLAKALVSVVAAPTGLAGVLTIPMSAIQLVVKYVLLIKEIIDVKEANQKIRDQKIDDALLKRHPVLGLTLPHLHGVDALPLLGILPLNWTKDHPGLQRLRLEAKDPKNRWLGNALNKFDPFNSKTTTIEDRWRDDFNRVLRLMLDTNYHLYEERFLLVNSTTKKELYTAPPVTRWQELKQFFMGKAIDSSIKIIDSSIKIKELLQKISKQGGEVVAFIIEKTMYKFHKMGRNINDEKRKTDDQDMGPIAQLTEAAQLKDQEEARKAAREYIIPPEEDV